MVQNRLQNRSIFQLIVPALLIFCVAAMSIISGHDISSQPRERIFDLFARLHARPIAAPSSVAIIDIDEDSATRIGPWPWPRTALAGLVTAAHEAGARAVVVTVSVDGKDPLSPEIAARYWSRQDTTGDVDRVLALLPTNNAALAAASANAPTVLGVGENISLVGPWTRADTLAVAWTKLQGTETTGFIALRATSSFGQIDPGFDETALVAMIGLPLDKDGVFRRTPLVWARGQQPIPTLSLASLAVAEKDIAILTPAKQILRAGGAPLSHIVLGEGETALNYVVDPQGGIRLWLPKDTSLSTIPAWRALEGGASWTQPLAGKLVFIGETITPQSKIMTARGPLPIAALHALLAEQLTQEAILARPIWAGLSEAGLAVLAGLIAFAAAIFLRPMMAGLIAFALSAVALTGTFMLFRNSGLLFSPTPMIATAIGVPFALFSVHVLSMLRGGEAARATFHGALPPATVARLQSKGPGHMLDGTRRNITVLSCGLSLPKDVLQSYEDRPADFIELAGSVNDVLRRTILATGGTVDFGEDGRLLGYWNAPEEITDPIQKACACGLKMIEEMNRLTDTLEAASFADATNGGFADGNLEIGIASGPCFAGPVGRGSRNRYAVIGQSVGLASTLRQRASLYGPAIITDENVFNVLLHQYAFLDLDIFKTDTDGSAQTIYGLSGNSFLKASRAFRQLADTQREMVLSWRNQDIPATIVQLQRLRGIAGVPDSYIELFEARLQGNKTPDQANASQIEVIAL